MTKPCPHCRGRCREPDPFDPSDTIPCRCTERAEPLPAAWQRALRLGFFPLLTTPALQALLAALRADDKRLLQGRTCDPQGPLDCVDEFPVEGACAIGYALWQGRDGAYTSVGDLDFLFARACLDADFRLGVQRGSRFFLSFWDDSPRLWARTLLAEEVAAELGRRPGVAKEAA